ncbi:MAG: hypothetical protein ACI8RZ_006075 [Myxococcota bacterium]|jgi:hypothetical protein
MLLLLLACKPDPAATPTSADSGEDCPGEVVETETVTNETYNGVASLSFDIAEGARAFLVTVEAEPNIFVVELTDPSGEVVYSYEDVYAVTPYEIPSAMAQPTANEAQISWPLTADDPAPAAGTWIARVYVLDSTYSPLNFAPVSATVFESRGEEEGYCLSARVVLSDGISDDADLVAVIEDAVARWTALYADQGITLTATIEDSNLSSAITLPASGDSNYATIDAAAAPEVITVVIGESFSGSADGVLGQTGGLPGPLLSTDRAAVGISWLMNAGLDAVFSEDETQMLSETIAHEVAHYLGLMHPVQFDENVNVVAFDALDDTPWCSDYYDCENDLGDNLMYPFARCWWESECDTLVELTGDQATVMRRYAGIR